MPPEASTSVSASAELVMICVMTAALLMPLLAVVWLLAAKRNIGYPVHVGELPEEGKAYVVVGEPTQDEEGDWVCMVKKKDGAVVIMAAWHTEQLPREFIPSHYRKKLTGIPVSTMM